MLYMTICIHCSICNLMARDENIKTREKTATSSSAIKSDRMRLIVEILLVVFVAISVHGLWNSVESFSQQPDDGVSKHSRHVDKAQVHIQSSFHFELLLYVLSTACYECPFQLKERIPPFSNKTVELDTQFTLHLYLKSGSSCNLTKTFVDQGDYTLTVINASDGFVCSLDQTNSPYDSNLPVYVALGIIIGVFVVWHLFQVLIRRRVFYRLAFFLPTEQLINTDLGSSLLNEDGTEVVTQQTRVRSVDAFRGFALVVMIFVNYGGGEYWYFNHSSWNGLTVADLVFPWFVFLMGTSIAMSFKGALRRGTSRWTIFWRVIKRTAMLFFLGLVISNSGTVALENLRIMGVLQRLALTYFVVAVLETISATSTDVHLRKWWSFARDLFPFWLTWLVCGCLILIHLCLTFLLPVPGCPTGYLGAGGLSENAQHMNCTGGAARYIDHLILGDSHMYQYPTCRTIFQTSVPFDPEGFLGLLMSIFLCILGLQAGKILVTYQYWVRRVRRWLIWAAFTGLLAGVLCRFEQNGGWIPVNKNLWSLSYVLALGSMAFLLLSILYVIIDVFDAWSGAPFLYPGMNSIVIYVCHEIFEDHFPISIAVEDIHLKHLCMDIWGTCCWLIVSAILFYKDIFIAI